MATKNHKLLAAGTAVLIAEPALAFAHTGSVGFIVGLAVGAIAYNAVEDVEQVSGREISLPASRKRSGAVSRRGGHSIAYRLLNGKSVRGEDPEVDDRRTRPGSAVDEDDCAFDEVYLNEGDASFVFSEFLEAGWRPSYDEVFLARLEDGTDVFVSVPQLVHIALAGSTRQGKTSIIRQLLVQLCYIGCICVLLDPHYTPYDVEIDEDWTPFTPFLQFDPIECKSYSRMAQILKYTVTTILGKRKELRTAMKPVGKAIFIAIDEYPSLVAEIPEVQGHVAKLLREGAKYKIFLMVASQDFQVKTISPQAGGAIRECYKTALYVGGDKTTANVLLDTTVPQEVEAQLGKGPVMLRCATVKQGRLAYTPYGDNEALYMLLGPSTYEPEGEVEEDDIDEDLEEIETEDLPAEPAKSGPVPYKQKQMRRATLADAIDVWNATGGNIGRPRLLKELKARGLDCSNYLAESLLEQIKERLVSDDGAAAADDGVADDERESV